MQLTVTTAAARKTAEYEDAFAPCPNCEDDSPIYKVTCSHAGTSIMSGYVPEPELQGAITQFLLTAGRLIPRIDAAVQAFAEGREV